MKTGRARTVVATIALVVVSTLSIGFLAAGTASAQSYPNVPTLSADKSTVDPCEDVILTGTGYLPNAQVTITVNGTFAGTTMTDSQGDFTFPYPVPCNAAAGQLLFTASDGTTTLSTTVSVSAKAISNGGSSGNGNTGTATGSAGSLPTTGSNTDTYLRIAVLLIALGGLVLLATRRRDRRRVDA